MRDWWEPLCQMAPSENGNSVTKRSISIVIDWETGGAIKINLAVHGWYPTPLHQADLGSRRPFDSVAATYRILRRVTLADDTKRRWLLDCD
jgi:hypothetical protein